MLNSKAIVEVANQYFANAPTQRVPERIQTLGAEVELETKINIKKLHDIEIILHNISVLGFSKASHRTEWHHFFSNKLIAHNVLILIKDSNEIWIKIKKDKRQVETPHRHLPILLRREEKIKPQDANYLDKFSKLFVKITLVHFKRNV